MRFSTIKTGTLTGLHVRPVTIEIDITQGLFSFTIVGLPDKTVAESRERIIAAIKNSGFDSPKTKHQKIVVSLTPAYLRKEGSHLDVPIAISYLVATKHIIQEPYNKFFIGELSLNGEILPVKGIIMFLQFAIQQGYTEVFIPYENKKEASLIQHLKIYPVRNIKDIVEHINNTRPLKQLPKEPPVVSSNPSNLPEIVGQEAAKRALIIAAAGAHSLIFCGPPGTGKSLLAKSFIEHLPNLSIEQSRETTAIHSLLFPQESPIWRPPFRAPHHTTSATALLGGGNPLRPGEITLAHNGVLFLDELPEFNRNVIECLREPLEEFTIKIARAKQSEEFPARCILIGSMNPCPCGYRGSQGKKCVCTAHQIISYTKKLSGPFMDRIDMWVQVDREEEAYTSMLSPAEKISSKKTLLLSGKRIIVARAIQHERHKKYNQQANLNGQIPFAALEHHLQLNKAAQQIIAASSQSLQLSIRSLHKVLRVARTIADLDNSIEIREPHILEALSFRFKSE